MGDNIMWTDFERFNESHFYRNTKKNETIFIKPEIENPDDRSVCMQPAVVCIQRAVVLAVWFVTFIHSEQTALVTVG